jgi:hypothetical protein
MKSIAIFFSIFLFGSTIWANGVSISNLTYNENDHTLSFDMTVADQFRYQLASEWRTEIRVFAKYKNANGSTYETLYFNESGHSITSISNGFSVTYENTGHRVTENNINYWMGIRINPNINYEPSDTLNLTLAIGDNMTLLNPDIKVFTTEMIRANYLTDDQWYLGDAISPNRWHAGDDTLAAFFCDDFGPFDTIDIGNGPNDINTLLPGGSLPANFTGRVLIPPVSMMRYNISQEQYVDFLNCLTRIQQNERTMIDLSGTTSPAQFVMTNYTGQVPSRNGISCPTNIGTGPIEFFCDLNMNGIGNEVDDGQNIACNHLSVNDMLAYLDWAGLRPINEFHYEWLCRGENIPVPGEYAWGSTDLNSVGGVLNSGRSDERNSLLGVDGPNININVRRVGIAAGDSTTRIQAGATTWGHMDMSGNGAEIVRCLFESTDFVNMPVGDGQLDLMGNHNELNWEGNYTHKGKFYSTDTQTVSERQGPILNHVNSFLQVGRGGM